MIICDNNLLASSKKHFKKVIDSLKKFPACDFNQGLDARLYTFFHANEIAKLKNPMVRFAFDNINIEGKVYDAINISKKAGLKKFGIYVLINFKDSPDEAIYKLEKVREWGILPGPMRYQPLDCLIKNSFIEKGWTDIKLKSIMRYYSRLNFLGGIEFSDYNRKKNPLYIGFGLLNKL